MGEIILPKESHEPETIYDLDLSEFKILLDFRQLTQDEKEILLKEAKKLLDE